MRDLLNGARQRLGAVLRDSLEQGKPIRLEGLGTFLPGAERGFRFISETKPRVFIAYVEEDLAASSRLFRALRAARLDAWLDKRKLLPGQNWPRAIESAIGASDYFIACFSKRATSKRGHFHCELRFALECAKRMPLDEIFLIPVRLDDCLVPPNISRHIQYVDLFPDWEKGLATVIDTIREQETLRRRKLLPLAG